MPTIQETEKSNNSLDFRQGDILQIEHAPSISSLPTLGVIINADCDLAHGKTDGVIAYLPVYSFREYLQHFWSPNYLSDVTIKSSKKVLEISKIEDGFENDLLNWLRSTELENVLSKLSTKAELKAKHKEELEVQLKKLKICLDSTKQPLDAFGCLCKLEKDKNTYAINQLSAAKKAMGDGHFFLSELYGKEELGYVIRMRRIYTLEETACFKSIAEQRTSSNGSKTTAIRVARLSDLYQFKIAQLFAHQYSRIGLPDEITALDEIAIESLTCRIIKEAK